MLSDPARRGGGWTREEFLATGAAEIEAALEATAAFGLPVRRDRALDFGTGAGRLARALSEHFGSAVGVDVSDEMVRVARELSADRPNLELVVNTEDDLGLFADGSFDFVYSNLVLQHLPTRALLAAFVRELVRVTAPDGVAVLQAPHAIPLAYRLQPLRRGYAALRRLGVPARALILRTPLQPMRMTALPRPAFEAAIAAAGGTVLDVSPDGAFGYRYVVAGPSATNSIRVEPTSPSVSST